MRRRTTNRMILSLVGIAQLVIYLLVGPNPASAQEDSELLLRLNRNFGFSSGIGQVQGNFTAKATGPETLTRVVFLIDDEIMGEDTDAPFELKFQTESYPLGVHTIRAIGHTSDGQELSSNEWRVEFVSAQQGWQTTGKIIIPLVVIIAVAMLSSFLLPMVLGRGKTSSPPPGTARSYGVLGGTICPKCQRPFSVHVWGLNLVAGKLDRCPYCGRWSLVRRVPMEMLRAAEAAELNASPPGVPANGDRAEEALHKDLEDSRYQDI